MKQDRFLVGIMIGIGGLIALALVLFFIRKDDSMKYGAEDTPEGVVHNYVVAIYQRDYQKAYTYLADLTNKPTYEQFRRSFLQNNVNPSQTGIEIGAAEINGNEAVVTVYIQYGAGDPFSASARNEDRATLIKQKGAWKIEQMPYNFWAYDWYQYAQPTPMPAP